MKILILTGLLLPTLDTNAKLLLRLLPALRKRHQVHILSALTKDCQEPLPEVWDEVPVHWADLTHAVPMDTAYRLRAQLLDRNGYSDALLESRLLYALNRLRKQYRFDAILTSMEPFVAAAAAADVPDVKRVLYLMDPPELLTQGDTTAYRKHRLQGIFSSQNLMITTPFIEEALRRSPMRNALPPVRTSGFPQILPQSAADTETHAAKDVIDILFCGWLYSDIRSPEYFLKLLSALDQRFRVTFMGKECDRLLERYPVKTGAELVLFPQQPFETAQKAIADADILINIGNSVPIHMPSKTLEYINTGKPIVNIYKLYDCPTLYYSKRYPLCLNLYERDDPAPAAARFLDFCLTHCGMRADHEEIASAFAECTPQYIAEQILDAFESTPERKS